MNYVLRFTAMALVLAVGCSKESAAPQATGAAPAQVAANSAPAPAHSSPPTQRAVTLPVNASSSPQEVVLAFLNGMRDGNSEVTAALLTERALQETVKHDWPVQPPGAPSATYQLGDPQFSDASQTVVQVPCLWSESDGQGGSVQFEVVWVLAKHPQGWRVAGFATELVPGKPPYFFNFEDITHLKATQAEAEAAMAAMAGAAQEQVAGEESQNTLR